MKWQVKEQQYGSTLQYVHNHIVLGEVSYNPMKARGDTEKNYVANIKLPSVRLKKQFFREEVTAKTAVEDLVKWWIDKINSSEE